VTDALGICLYLAAGLVVGAALAVALYLGTKGMAVGSNQEGAPGTMKMPITSASRD
jgi:hypothetical protein